ncbi:MAG: hypothetical protein CMI96_00480 [Pelagibacteraceae bacterium]|nr:hypothetical protein [Pelagibacteraceae bacterium]|tara:strand:+ start:1557 stop:1916 length:360 start_codon:yes stop_codon:yes gene_type:complete
MFYKVLFLALVLFSSSAVTEIYSCKYNQAGSEKIITFDRVNHSHFKICYAKNCDDKLYMVIYADNDSLIFGDVIKKEKNLNSFKIIILDKNKNLFTSNKIKFPNSNFKNEFISGGCTIN